MDTNKKLKLIFNLFRILGWLLVAESIILMILGWKNVDLSNYETLSTLVLFWTFAFMQMSRNFYFRTRRKFEPDYKVDMNPHYKSGFYTMWTMFALIFALAFFSKLHILTYIILSFVIVYLVIYLTNITRNKNDRI